MAIRGRPRTFDRGEALVRAMEVFWVKGYEGAQLVDLTAAMGINPPSFYAAFESKMQIFREAVSLYVETVGATSVNALNHAQTARAGLQAMLNCNIDVALSNRAGGCLMVLGVVNNLPDNIEAYAYLKAERKKLRSLICKRIKRGITEGDLPVDTKANALAAYVLGVTQAISFQARDGASKAELKQLVTAAMAAVPGPSGQYRAC